MLNERMEVPSFNRGPLYGSQRNQQETLVSFSSRRPNSKSLGCDRSGFRTLLRQESPDFSPQDLITCGTQMDLIIHEQSSDRLAILSEHVGRHVDVFCLRLGL